MITPQEAARIAEAHPNEEVQKAIANTEKNIAEAARHGHRETPITCAYWLEDEVADFFRREGWRVTRERRYSGGVLQHALYYLHW